jgi:hypothetical protein
MADINTYLDLVTSEHQPWPNFLAMNTVLFQAFVDQQNLLATFPDIFDVDEAVGDQEDILGLWIGVTRNLNQTIDVPIAEDDFQRANGGLGPNWTTGTAGMEIVSDSAQNTGVPWGSSFWTQAATDNFTRANENPLNPADWEVAPTITGSSPFAPLQIIGDQCVASTLASECAEVYIGIPFGNDQFSQITLGDIASGGSVGLFVRSSAAGLYSVDVGGPLGAGVEIDLIVANQTGESLLGSYIGTVNVGDTVGLNVTGSTITVYLNGTPIITINDTTLTTGLPGIFCVPNAVVTDSAITEWTSGPAIFEPDQFAKVTIANGSPIGPAVRMTTGGNFYALVVSFDRLFIYKVVADFTTPLNGGTPYIPVVGDVLTLEVTGNVLTGKVNGQTLATAQDSTFANGTPGIAALGAGGIATFWEAGSLPGISVLDDDDYRTLLKLFIAMNSWDGTVPGIYTIWNSLFPEYPILVQDNQDMTMTVVFINPPTNVVILALFTQGYFLLRPAGVRITGFFEPSGPLPIFGADIENATISGPDVGYLVTPINI